MTGVLWLLLDFNKTESELMGKRLLEVQLLPIHIAIESNYICYTQTLSDVKKTNRMHNENAEFVKMELTEMYLM